MTGVDTGGAALLGQPDEWVDANLDVFDAAVLSEAELKLPRRYVCNLVLRAARSLFPIDDERWRIMTRKRWAGLTHDLRKIGPIPDGKSQSLWLPAHTPVDTCSPDLETEIGPIRVKLKTCIEDKLSVYDKSSVYPRAEDSVCECRDGYERFLRGEAVKELRGTIRKYAAQAKLHRFKREAAPQTKLEKPKLPIQQWKVVGGAANGGIIVRIGVSLESPKADCRLSTGALIEQRTHCNDRLEYRLISGTGPQTGWVSTTIRVHDQEKPMVVKAGLVSSDIGPTSVIPGSTVVRGASHGGAMPGEAMSPTKLIIVGLMAAHLRTEARVRRLGFVLRSIRNQDIPDGVEFHFVLSWSSSPELESAVNTVLVDACVDPACIQSTVFHSILQSERHTQFQHLKAALVSVEQKLRRLSANRCSLEGPTSAWVLFGDDDDIWHHKRISEYVRAIRAHPILVGVGAFATTTRANCKPDTKLTDADMPVTEEDVDSFFSNGNGVRMEKGHECVQWSKEVKKAGPSACLLQAPGQLGLEYFDFCPRFRIVLEFFSKTSPKLISHRYCDLRFAEFLRSYPWIGTEMGLEISFFEPRCWMLFYSTPIPDFRQWERSVEVGSKVPAIDVNNGHMSSSLDVGGAEIELARRMHEEFCEYEEGIAPSRLARYWAAFRNSLELYMVAKIGKVDQRIFDLCVFMSVNSSFFKFSERIRSMKDKTKGEKAERMMYYVGQGFGKAIAANLDVDVLWVKPEIFVGRDFYYMSQGYVVPLLGAQKSKHHVT